MILHLNFTFTSVNPQTQLLPKAMMSVSDYSSKTRVEEKENSSQQDRSTEVSEPSKYFTRAAKKLEEHSIYETPKQFLAEEATKKPRNGILKSKQSSEREAKKYKETFRSFKRKMVEAYGEEFHYKGGSWHGEESRRYRHHHIRKSMRFLTENMNSSDE